MKYLFKQQKAIERKLRGKYLFIFLDFDGTIAPFRETPDKAAIPLKAKILLKRISIKPGLRLAIISGRSLNDIKSKVGLKDVIYSGNHGLEIEGPKINFTSLVSPGYRMILGHIKNDLQRKTSSIRGAFVEDKGLSLSLHYRLTQKGQIARIKALFHETVAPYLIRNKIKIKPAKMVWEVRPPIAWDKGKAVLWLLSRQDFSLPKAKIFPVYIGDDLTDEDAFKALRGKGLTVFVGRRKNSYADYYLRNTEEVARFLCFISELNLTN
jgi:trehalose-phosphatase